MLNLVRTARPALCLIALLAMTGPVFAQSTDAEQGAQPGSGAVSGISSQLSMGQDADAPDDMGQPYTRKEIGDWELRCLRTDDAENDPCQMYQLLVDGDDVPVAEVSLFRLPQGGQAEAGATVIVPLETALPNQLTIRIDGGAAKRYPYAFCNQLGCYARIGLTQEDVAAFKRGREATLTIVPALAPDQIVELTLSLTGFTASYDETSVIAQ